MRGAFHAQGTMAEGGIRGSTGRCHDKARLDEVAAVRQYDYGVIVLCRPGCQGAQHNDSKNGNAL